MQQLSSKSHIQDILLHLFHLRKWKQYMPEPSICNYINTHEPWEGMIQPHHPMYSSGPACNPIGPSRSPRICKLIQKSLANISNTKH